MAAIATNALEPRWSPLDEQRQLLINLELNNVCANTHICGSNCYLNVISEGKRMRPLPSTLVFSAASEIIANGWDVRHLVLPGKEVWESPELLLRIIEQFHAAPAHSRPGSLGIITASPVGLRQYANRLADSPLSWTAISMDTSETGLRSSGNNRLLLESALHLKEVRGTELLGVNTLVTGRNLEGVLQIGQELQRIGIDQWTLSPLLQPENGRMEPVLSNEELVEITERVIVEFGGSSLNIVFDHIDLLSLDSFTNTRKAFHGREDRWRIEYELPDAPNITLITGNMRPGYFLRLDWAGQLMSKEDFRRIAQPGCYGHYTPGKCVRLLEELRELRSELACVA
jgi:hypothetical protein